MKLTEFRTMILIFSLFKDGLSVQSFLKTPVYTEVNPMENVTLHCIILNKKGDCIWQRNNKALKMQPNKYDWAGDLKAGDCSVRISGAGAEFDEGEWECQVTDSDFSAKDALTSESVKLVVRSPPQKPRIESNGSQVLPNNNVTVKSDAKAVLSCVSRYGTPPAVLKWFLDNEEIRARSNQTNIPEEDNPRTFKAVSVLELYVNKSHHQRTIKCVAIHESYPSKSESVEVRLDISYAPEVTIIGVPHHDIEEGKDDVNLQCIADANPPAQIKWQRIGSRDLTSVTATLQFKPVNQRDSGTYSCSASNSAGGSLPVSTVLDVKYAPIIKSVGPDKLTTAPLYSSASFECKADGNPPPKYQWLQRVANVGHGSQDIVIARSTEPKIFFSNITYDFQGEYVCTVTNTIAGNEKTAQSQPITLQVMGAPQVIKQSERKHEVIVHRGDNAMLSAVVCADPRPRRTAWEWGSHQIEAGAGVDRYQAEELLQDTKEDCYVARFHVKDVNHLDARSYYLTVENERGLDKHSIYLAVRGSYTEPLGISTVFTIAVGSLIGFMICVLLAFYILRSDNCCSRRRPSRRGDFKPSDTESCHNDNEKSEIKASNGLKPPKIESMMDNGLHNDLLYCTSPTRRPPPPHAITAAGCSPDAMKHKRRPIYESEVCVVDNTLPSKSRSERAPGSSRVSTFRADYIPNSTLECGPQTGSRYRKKSNSSSKRSAKKRNTFTELQIPTVSDNGATRNRMACYNRQIIVHSDLQTYSVTENSRSGEYFCPQTSKSYNDNCDYDYDDRIYDEMRSYGHGYAEKDLI